MPDTIAEIELCNPFVHIGYIFFYTNKYWPASAFTVVSVIMAADREWKSNLLYCFRNLHMLKHVSFFAKLA